jgi:hypothetical protein
LSNERSGTYSITTGFKVTATFADVQARWLKTAQDHKIKKHFVTGSAFL